MRSFLRRVETGLVICGLSCLLIAVGGCTDFASAEVQQFRQRFLSAVSPQGEVAISSVRAQLKSGELAAGAEVVVRARINAGEMPPWAEGRAEFFITDATGHDGDEDHDPHECPFCKRDVMESMALVRLAGSDGRTIPIDTRELLGVRERSLLVIRGTVNLEESGPLVLTADQIHVVRQ